MRKQYTLTCQHCKNSFNNRNRHRIYCSYACHLAANPPTIVPRPCEQCGATMLLTMKQCWAGKRFCSPACRYNARRHTDVGKVLESNLQTDASTGCRLWQGKPDHQGYGKVSFDGITWRAHRLAYTYYCGPIPAGLDVCHECDTPLCCNPDHLWLGDNVSNTADRHQKGRTAQGERHWKARLNDEQVREIRALSVAKVRRVEIADRFGVSTHTIAAIAQRRLWKHVA